MVLPQRMIANGYLAQPDRRRARPALLFMRALRNGRCLYPNDGGLTMGHAGVRLAACGAAATCPWARTLMAANAPMMIQEAMVARASGAGHPALGPGRRDLIDDLPTVDAP